jgi:hypothetical protein
MRKVTTTVLAAALAISSTFALAQGVGSSTGGIYSGSFIGNPPDVPTFGAGTTRSTTAGLGNGSNPGIGDRSDPSIRASPGLDANGPCNGARSTSGNNTPSC